MNETLSFRTRLWILFTVSSSVITYTAGPEEVPSVLQHSINVDELALSDGDEPAVSRVIILQGTSDQDGVCRFKKTNTENSRTWFDYVSFWVRNAPSHPQHTAVKQTLGSTHGCSRSRRRVSWRRV